MFAIRTFCLYSLLNSSLEVIRVFFFVVTVLVLTGCDFLGLSNRSPISVTIESIAITPITSSVAIGRTLPFVAIATYSNALTADISDQVTWSSSDTSVAVIDNTGLATGLAVGATNITASSGAFTSNMANLTVATAPNSVFAVSASNQITLSWYPVAGAIAYNLYYSMTAGVEKNSNKINGVSSPYTQGGLNQARTYFYRVSAVHANGEVLSDEVSSYIYPTGNPIGSFRTISGMTTTRYGHSSTLIPNSEALIIGGTTGLNFLPSAEKFNSILDTWNSTESLALARAAHTATPMSNGKILIAGGFNGSFLSSCELFDYKVNRFSATGSLMSVRSYHTATLMQNGKVLIAGGNNGLDYLASAELYDPTIGAFTAAGSMSTGRYFHSATLLPNGKILINGGYDGAVYLTSAELFDPETGSFSNTGSMLTNRAYTTATLLPDGKVLVVGGYNGNALTNAELYDPVTGNFSNTGNMTTPRYFHTATLLPNGKVLISGGYDGATFLASAEIYDPTLGIFTYTGSLVSQRSYHAATMLPNGKVLITGGTDVPPNVNVELFE